MLNRTDDGFGFLTEELRATIVDYLIPFACMGCFLTFCLIFICYKYFCDKQNFRTACYTG